MTSNALKPIESEAGRSTTSLRTFIGPTMPEVVATVTHYFSRLGVAVLSVHSPLQKGDAIHIIGRMTNIMDTVRSMEINHRQIEIAFPGDDVALKVSPKVREGDKIYIKTASE